MMKKKILISSAVLILMVANAFAYEHAEMRHVQTQASLGSIEVFERKGEYFLHVVLKKMAPGAHGFHLHQYPTCESHGLAAGGHYDPTHSQKHRGPSGGGHYGDLPRLLANAKGVIDQIVPLPKNLSGVDLKQHSFIVHAGGDNYHDIPLPLGGGGDRLACGVLHEGESYES